MQPRRRTMLLLSAIAVLATPAFGSPPPDTTPPPIADLTVSALDVPREAVVNVLDIGMLVAFTDYTIRAVDTAPAQMIEASHRVQREHRSLRRTVGSAGHHTFAPFDTRDRGGTARLNRRIGSPHS
jgi:hypothetical protein